MTGETLNPNGAFERAHPHSDREKKFKSARGRLITYGLFHGGDRSPIDNSLVLYTLWDEDYGDWPSIKRLYLEERDPTEILFAQKYFYSYQHFLLCCKGALKNHIGDMREELETLLRAEALQNIQKMASDESSKHFYQANKMLVDKGWKDKETTTVAAKERIKRKAEELHQAEMEIQEDAALLESYQKGQLN